MSRTLSVGVVGPGYWSYTASVMAECLDEITRTKHVDVARIPKGVYDQAQKFFRLVLETATDALPENPPASINAYVIAADVIRGASDPLPQTRKELDNRLERCAHFLGELRASRDITDAEVETATYLQKFF